MDAPPTGARADAGGAPASGAGGAPGAGSNVAAGSAAVLSERPRAGEGSAGVVAPTSSRHHAMMAGIGEREPGVWALGAVLPGGDCAQLGSYVSRAAAERALTSVAAQLSRAYAAAAAPGAGESRERMRC